MSLLRGGKIYNLLSPVFTMINILLSVEIDLNLPRQWGDGARRERQGGVRGEGRGGG